MIICDSVHVDQATGKTTLVGAFTAIAATSFPAMHPHLAIFIELTDGRGETDLVLKFCRVTAASIDGEEIARFEGMTNFTDPRTVQRITFGIGNVLLPTSGEYRFILETKAGQLVSERRLVAMQAS